jgi:hypothetical protein
MKADHDQMAGDESQDAAHRQEVHQASAVIAAEQPAERRKLNRLRLKAA